MRVGEHNPSELTMRNAILGGLAAHDRDLLRPHLRPVAFAAGAEIRSPRLTENCLFIESGLVSLLCEPDGMCPVEVGLVGTEGLLGLPAILGAATMTYSVATVTDCSALAIRSADLRLACQQSPRLHETLLRYADTRLAQVMKRSACHLQHRLEQRLADWILAATDRLNSPRISITHKQLAELLGATRPGVTLAIQELEGRRAIRARRNLIGVRSRAALSMIACRCHSADVAAPHRAMTNGMVVPVEIAELRRQAN
jgi:CRP-like cAMP-binding protein